MSQAFEPDAGRRRAAFAMLLWPLAIWGALRLGEPRFAAAAALLGLAGVALAARRTGGGFGPFVPAILLAVVAALTGERAFLLAQPVLVNLAVAATFGLSLRPGAIPLIERIARTFGDLPQGAAGHCRLFTWLWFLFALANAGLGAILTARDDIDLWAAWTGPGSYAAIALLFGVEWSVRRVRFGPLPKAP